MANKFKHKEYPISAAQIAFENENIVTQRPATMPYNDYKVIRSFQTKLLRMLKGRGRVNQEIRSAMGSSNVWRAGR